MMELSFFLSPSRRAIGSGRILAARCVSPCLKGGKARVHVAEEHRRAFPIELFVMSFRIMLQSPDCSKVLEDVRGEHGRLKVFGGNQRVCCVGASIVEAVHRHEISRHVAQIVRSAERRLCQASCPASASCARCSAAATSPAANSISARFPATDAAGRSRFKAM